jgi:glycosyltransferase involved in cell wall biosynthesis
MKVLTIINSLATGGAEKLILDVIPAFNKRFKNDVLLLKESNAPFEQKLKEDKSVAIFSTNLKSEYNPLHIFKIIPYLKKYDIIHVHLFPTLYWVGIAKVISFSKVNLVFTEHNTSNRRVDKWCFKLIDTFIYFNYKKIISISPKVYEMIIDKIKIKHEKVISINNGIHLNTISKATPYNKSIISELIKNTDKILIQVSRFEIQKDQKTLIKTLQLLEDSVKLILIGEVVLKQECMQLVEKLQLTKRVFFLGIRMDVPQLLKTADIVVLSSHYEGMSLSSIEGLASGKPFIASDVPGLTEVVQGAGLLFEDNDEVGLANHIKKLLSDENYYNQIATQCQERAKAYDIEIMIEKHITLYKSLQLL